MKLKSYFLMGLATLALTSCDDDFNDWTKQATNEQDEIVQFGSGTVQAVDVIDFANVTTDSVQVAAFTAPTASSAAYKPSYQISLAGTNVNIDAKGQVAAADLKSYVESTYGKAPTEREISSQLIATLSDGSVATTIKSDEFPVKVKLVAPEISDAYYIIGGTLDWGQSAADHAQPFTHIGGGNVYDYPEFTIVLPVNRNADTWFAIADEKAIEGIANGDWSMLIGCTDGNGNNGMTGHLDRRSVIGNDASLKVNVDADYVKITINMMDATFAIEAVDFKPYIYEIGNSSGWSKSEPLYSANLDGQYLGFAYLDGEYKFKPNEDNWDGDYGQAKDSDEGTLVQEDEQNCAAAAAGYYAISVDLAAMTFSKELISTISLIGSAVNGDTSWGTDYDMTYNAETNTWDITTELTTGEFKFRANHEWAYNWGGTTDALTQGGDNITITEAGTYTISLSALCDTKATYTITQVK